MIRLLITLSNFINNIFFCRYDQTKIIDPVTGSLNVTAYENYSPVYLSAAFAVSYYYSFMLPPAIICHVILFHGKEILDRYRKTREEEEESDIHCKMMNVYSGYNNFLSFHFLKSYLLKT